MENFDANNGNEENNYDEIDRQINSAHDKRQQKQQNVQSDNDTDILNSNNKINDKRNEFLKEVIIAEVITKRVIGKVMIKYCGNEGAEHDERTRSLRKLLQAVIDYIQNNPRINWKNAEVTVYDIDDNSFTITSGEGKYQYVVTDDEMGGVELINTSNKVHKPKPPQKPQPNKEPTRNLHTREKRSSNRTTGGFHPYSNSNESHHQHNHGDNTNETEGGMNCTIS